MTKPNEETQPKAKEAPEETHPKLPADRATGRLAVLPPPKPSVPRPAPVSSASGAFQKVSAPSSASGAFTKVTVPPSGTFPKVPSETQKSAEPPSAKPLTGAFPKVPSPPVSSASGAFAKVPSAPGPKPVSSPSGSFQKVQSILQPQNPSSGSVKAVSKAEAKPQEPEPAPASPQSSEPKEAPPEAAAPASPPVTDAPKPQETKAEPTPALSKPQEENKPPQTAAPEAKPAEPLPASPQPALPKAIEPKKKPKIKPSKDDSFVQIDIASLLLEDGDAPPEFRSQRPTAPLPALTEGASPQVIPEGLILDSRYRLLKLLGEGGMGAVYKAEHLLMRKPVAIKILKKEAAVDRDLVLRFIREAQLASRLSNPHCVTIHDFGQTPDRDLYLVMELIEGEVLRDVMIHEGKLSLERAYEVMVQLLEALGAANDIGVIHRDVKPENVMLIKESNKEDSPTIAKLLDFGIARPSAPVATGVTRAGFTVGTPGYIAPEQALGRALDGRTDLYAAAVIFYEMLCGRRPYLGNTPMEIITNQVSQPPPRPSQVAPEAKIPIVIEDVVIKALSKDPDKRYPNAKEFQAGLEKAMEKAGRLPSRKKEEAPPEPKPVIPAQPLSPEERMTDEEILKVAGQRRLLWTLLGIALGLLVGVLGTLGVVRLLTPTPKSLPTFAPLPPVSPIHHYSPIIAQGLYEKGDAQGAKEALLALDLKDRNTPEVQTLFALVASRLGDWSLMRASIRAARTLAPFPPELVETLLRSVVSAQGSKEAAEARTAACELGADAVNGILAMLLAPEEATKKTALLLLVELDASDAPRKANIQKALSQLSLCPERQTLLKNLTSLNYQPAASTLSELSRKNQEECLKGVLQKDNKP